MLNTPLTHEHSNCFANCVAIHIWINTQLLHKAHILVKRECVLAVFYWNTNIYLFGSMCTIAQTCCFTTTKLYIALFLYIQIWRLVLQSLLFNVLQCDTKVFLSLALLLLGASTWPLFVAESNCLWWPACLTRRNAAFKDDICRAASWKGFRGHLAVTSSPVLLQVAAGNDGIKADQRRVCKYFIGDVHCEPSALSLPLNIWFPR